MHVQFRQRLVDMAQIIGADADEIVVQLREARERIAYLEAALRAMFDAYEGVFDMTVPELHQSDKAKGAEAMARTALGKS